jgi:hypothetical protein
VAPYLEFLPLWAALANFLFGPTLYCIALETNFTIKYLGGLETEFENILECESGA